MVSLMPKERREEFPFKDCIPDSGFIKGFKVRHNGEIHLGHASKHEEVRYRACHAEIMTTHFLAFQKLLRDNNVDPSRLANLDETGYTPGKDVAGMTEDKRWTRNRTRQEALNHNHR